MGMTKWCDKPYWMVVLMRKVRIELLVILCMKASCDLGDISSDEGGNEADNESEATTTTSDSDSDARSETSSDNSDGTESGNDADDECSSTTTDNGSRRSSVSLPDNNDADVNEDATIASSNNEEEPAAPATDQPAALVQTRVNGKYRR